MSVKAKLYGPLNAYQGEIEIGYFAEVIVLDGSTVYVRRDAFQDLYDERDACYALLEQVKR